MLFDYEAITGELRPVTSVDIDAVVALTQFSKDQSESMTNVWAGLDLLHEH